MTKREEERRRRLLRRWKVPECICNLEKPKDTILDVLFKVASLLAAVSGIFLSLSNKAFAIYAEHFYGVPSLYFYNDRIFDFDAMVPFALILVFIWLIPCFVKKVSKKSEFNVSDRLLFSLAVALVVLIESLIIFDYFFGKSKLCVLLSFVLSILSFIGYDLLFFVIARNNANEGTKKFKLTSLYTEHSKVLKVISGTLYVLTVVTIFLMTFILTMKLSPLDPVNQRGYEFISGKESGYRIVVGHYRDSVILMKGSTSVVSKRQSTKECPEKESQLTIIKGDYRIEPLGERQIEYRQFCKVGVEPKDKE